MRKIKNFLILFGMKLRKVPNPMINAHKYRLRGYSVGGGTYIYSNCKIDKTKNASISIGENCVLTGCTILAHDASTRKYFGETYFAPIKIGDNCFIGMHSIILPGVSVGDNSIVGAGSVVTRDVPPNSVVAGNPAKVIKTVDELIKKRRMGMNIHIK